MAVPTFPIPQFYKIDSANITDSINQLIVDLNALFLVAGEAPTPGTIVTMKQVYAWASNNGVPLYMYTLDQACPADIANAVNIQWRHGGTMIQGDALYRFIQATLGFNDAQMLLAFAAMQAGTITVISFTRITTTGDTRVTTTGDTRVTR